MFFKVFLEGLDLVLDNAGAIHIKAALLMHHDDPVTMRQRVQYGLFISVREKKITPQEGVLLGDFLVQKSFE